MPTNPTDLGCAIGGAMLNIVVEKQCMVEFDVEANVKERCPG